MGGSPCDDDYCRNDDNRMYDYSRHHDDNLPVMSTAIMITVVVVKIIETTVMIIAMKMTVTTMITEVMAISAGGFRVFRI